MSWKASRNNAISLLVLNNKEYEKFRVIQDKEYKSDFDETISVIKDTGKLPEPSHERFGIKSTLKKLKEKREREEKSDFNKKLKKGLNWNPKDHKDNDK